MSCSCSMKDCKGKPQWQITYWVWAEATPVAERHSLNCAKMQTSLLACDDCKNNGKVPENAFTHPDGRARIRAIFEARGMVPPDLDNPKLNFEPIVGEPVDIQQMVRNAELAGKNVVRG